MLEEEPVSVPLDGPAAAAARRNRIPFWAMPVLAALPLWAYSYQATLEPAPTGELTPLEQGAALYTSAGCGSCHMADGSGNASVPALMDVREVWPDFRDHMLWVRLGNRGWFEATGASVYGADSRASNNGFMPPFDGLTDQQLAAVVLYERVTFGGLEESEDEYEALLAIAQGVTTFAEVGLGAIASTANVDDFLLAG